MAIPKLIVDKIKKGAFPYFYAGGANKKNEEILNERGCLRLQSYAMERNNIMKRINGGYPTFIDSGAYSAMTKGIKINIDDYIEFINTYDEHIILACQWDIIPDKNTDPETSAKKTWENFLYMRQRVNNPDKLLYVWHSAEDIKWLEQALNLEPRIEYMALGGLVGKSVKQRDAAMKLCFDTIANSKNPDICVHAFGMSNRKLLKKYPFTSADSTSWLQPVRFGNINALDFKTFLISERQLESAEHLLNIAKEKKDAVEFELTRLGYSIQQLVDNPGLRTVYQTVYWDDYYSHFEQDVDNPVTRQCKKEIGEQLKAESDGEMEASVGLDIMLENGLLEDKVEVEHKVETQADEDEFVLW